MNCQCQQVCRKACKTRPGWFARGEVEKAAKAKGMTPNEFAMKYLVADQAVLDNPVQQFFIPSPVTTNAIPGTLRSDTHTGVCIFYENGKCSIHETKPAECRLVDHTTTPVQHRQIKIAIANTWRRVG